MCFFGRIFTSENESDIIITPEAIRRTALETAEDENAELYEFNEAVLTADGKILIKTEHTAYEFTAFRILGMKYMYGLIFILISRGYICMKTHIPPNAVTAEHNGAPPIDSAAETPSVTSKIMRSHNPILSFFIYENNTLSSAENNIIHAEIEIIALAEFETEDVKTSENEAVSVFSEAEPELCIPPFLLDKKPRTTAVRIDDINVEASTATPEKTEFNTAAPTVFIIKPGPAFTQKDTRR